MSRRPAPTLAALIALPVAGNFAGDSALIAALDTFIWSDASFADRAAALRHLAVNVLGLDGRDAGVGVSDRDFLQLYYSAV